MAETTDPFRVSPRQEQINRQMMALGRAIREDDENEVNRLVFNLAADALGDLARAADALESIAKLLGAQVPHG